MFKENAIEVKKLSKMFKLYRRPVELLWNLLFNLKTYEEFWALKNISFKIKKGEVVGIIGRNGAGKSTLLRILSGVLDRTSGQVEINGKISTILELGTGFHPEYTGRENIYNGGMILGMTKKEIEKKMDAIIKFSELEEFIDRPFKTYSDGMKTRLTFSVATAIEPEILIIDEALAAGDSFFINKCIQRITDLCASGATVLFVSHSTFLIQRLCNRAILLEKGRIKADGEPVEVCQEYELSVMKDINKKLKIENKVNNKSDAKKIISGGPIRISKVEFLDAKNREKYSFIQGEEFKVKIHYEAAKPVDNPGVYCLITKGDGVYATSFFSGEKETFHNSFDLGKVMGRGSFEISWDQLLLGDGDYYLTVGLFPKKTKEGSALHNEPYCLHDRTYQIQVKRAGRPLMTIFDQKTSFLYKKEK